MKLKSVKKIFKKINPFRKETLLDKIIKTWHTIKTNKILFFTQFLMTIVFLFILVLLSFNFSITAGDYQRDIQLYLEEAEINDPYNQPLGSDPLSLLKATEGIKNEMIKFGFSLFGSYFIFGFINMLLTKLMIRKKNIQEFVQGFPLVFFSYSLIFFGIIFAGFKLFSSEMLTGVNNSAYTYILWAFFVIILYFYHISSSLTIRYPIEKIPRKTIEHVKNIKISVFLFLKFISVFIIFNYLIYYFTERNVLISFIALIILLFSTVSFRVLFANTYD